VGAPVMNWAIKVQHTAGASKPAAEELPKPGEQEGREEGSTWRA
jgi:hypothetical protein